MTCENAFAYADAHSTVIIVHSTLRKASIPTWPFVTYPDMRCPSHFFGCAPFVEEAGSHLTHLRTHPSKHQKGKRKDPILRCFSASCRVTVILPYPCTFSFPHIYLHTTCKHSDFLLRRQCLGHARRSKACFGCKMMCFGSVCGVMILTKNPSTYVLLCTYILRIFASLWSQET